MPVWAAIAACGVVALAAAAAGYWVGSYRRVQAAAAQPTDLLDLLKAPGAQQRVLLDALLSTTPDQFHVHDAEGRILYVSPKALEALGLSREYVIGKTWRDVSCSDETNAAFTARLRRVFETGEAVRAEDLLPICDDDRTFEQVLSPFCDRTGQVIAVVSTMRDITKRRHAEIELRESEEKYRRLYEIESDAISLIDNETGSILEVNPAFERMYGYTRGELLQMHNFDLSAEPDQTRRAVQNGLTHIPIRHHRKRDGTVFTVEIMAGFLTWHGRPCHVAAIRDVSEWVATQAALRQRTADLEEQNAELDAFAHTVAHDLQNPLGVIIGYAAMLLDNFGKLGPGQPQHGLRIIDQSAQKMSRIIRELLLLSVLRTEAVKTDPLDMVGIVAGAQHQVARLVEEAGAEVRVPESWPLALGYGPWIEEVWANYLSNAIKYGGTPPQVVLGAEIEADGMVRFWVRDNGEGLTSEDQARLFTPHTRLNQARAKGHGLGLSIVRRIVTKLGGDVGVHSTVGQGSEFYFRLPVAE